MINAFDQTARRYGQACLHTRCLRLRKSGFRAKSAK